MNAKKEKPKSEMGEMAKTTDSWEDCTGEENGRIQRRGEA